MRNPNGYGCVHKLSGKRRRPYMATVTTRIGTRRKKDISFLRDALGNELYRVVYDKYDEYFKGRAYAAEQERKVIGYYSTRREAMEALAEYNRNPYDLNARQATFSDLYELWEKTGYDGLSRSTVTARKSAYKHCQPLWDMPVSEIKSLHLQAVMDSVADKSDSTRQNVKTVMKIVFTYAAEHDIIVKDYSQYVKISLRKGGADEPKESIHSPYTSSEIQTLWDNIDMPGVRIILLMIYTGTRSKEIFIMESADVNIEEHYMIGGVKTKSGKRRIIPLHNDILPIVKDMLADNGKYLVKHLSGDKPLYYNYFVQQMHDPTLKKLSMDHLPHDCRHTFATAADRCIDKAMMQRIMGHKLDTLADRVYIHKTAEELVEAVNRIKFIYK